MQELLLKERTLLSDLWVRGAAAIKPQGLDGPEGFETSLKGIVEKGFSPLLIPKRKVVLILKAKRGKD